MEIPSAIQQELTEKINNKKRRIYIPLGDFNHTDNTAIIKSLTQLAIAQKITFDGQKVMLAGFKAGLFQKYNTQQLTDNDFYKAMLQLEGFGFTAEQLSQADFYRHWNKMVSVPDTKLPRMRDAILINRETDIEVVIVSNTNLQHLEHSYKLWQDRAIPISLENNTIAGIRVLASTLVGKTKAEMIKEDMQKNPIAIAEYITNIIINADKNPLEAQRQKEVETIKALPVKVVELNLNALTEAQDKPQSEWNYKSLSELLNINFALYLEKTIQPKLLS